MLRPGVLITFCLFVFFPITAQKLVLSKDSALTINEVIVHAYEYDKPIHEIPGAISVMNKKDFNRFNNASILPVMNSAAGVRMEERSPGSYRLSIRGSSLRSPFGVRNVKVYWNDLPLTDPGGNTYLNLLDVNSIDQAEIIKGPGSSLYGSGNGGVVLLRSPTATYNQQQLNVSYSGGSFGMGLYNVGYQSGTLTSNITAQYAHQQADGYREQSAMQRDFFMVRGKFNVNDRSIISTNFFYSDLNYQTPGALTKVQYDQNPRQARPAVGSNKGAIDQRATVYNKTLYMALSQEQNWSKKWSTRSGVYSTFTSFQNPTIRNFERRVELSYGARSVTNYSTHLVKVSFGGEFQHGFSPIKIYDNNGGISGSLRTDEEIESTSAFAFSQIDWSLPLGFNLTTGISYNFYTVGSTRFSTSPSTLEKRSFTPIASPRVALLKKINPFFSFYVSYSQGFSPPTVAELYPSTSIFNNNIKAETGNNYEAGLKGGLLNEIVQFGLTAYSFQLKQTIVSRRDTTLASAPEFFANAGSTSQKGIELNVSLSPKFQPGSFLTTLRLWTSCSFNHYRFNDYVKDDTIRYSGNILTGTSPNAIVVGLDIFTALGISTNLTYNFTDRIPLNDANSVFSDSYNLFGCRFGYRLTLFKNYPFDLFGGADNILDVKYSLGNDLNANGGLYYNAASGRNFFIGLKSTLNFKRQNL